MTKVLNTLKSHFKDYPDAYMKAGDFYFRIGDADQAIRQYQEGMSADTANKVDYQKRVIEVLIRQGKTAQAYEKDLEILKDNPKDPEARGLKASFLLDKGDIDAAVIELQAVVTAKPDNFVARFNLGRAYFAKGDLEQARQQFEAALKLRPDYMPARLALTQLALRRGDCDAALKMAQETLKINPSAASRPCSKPRAYLRKGQFDEARALLEKILKVNPNQADTLLELGVLNLMQKRYKEAEEPFRKAYAVDPSNLRGLLGLAEIQFQQKQPDKAIQLIADEVAETAAACRSEEGTGQRRIPRPSIGQGYRGLPVDSRSLQGCSHRTGRDSMAASAETYAVKGDLGKGDRKYPEGQKTGPHQHRAISASSAISTMLPASSPRPWRLIAMP